MQNSGVLQLSSVSSDDADAHFPQVLVVDDSPIQLKAVSVLLRVKGYEVSEAGSGHHAVRHLKECAVDLLLLDLNMPDGDGFEVLNHVQDHLPDLRVMILSGMSAEEIQTGMRRLRKQNLPMLLQKPIDPDQLIRLVEMQLGGELPGSTVA